MKFKRGLVIMALMLITLAVGVMTPMASTKVQAAKYTIKTFPKRIRGNWYTYDRYDHKVTHLKITAKKLVNGHYIQRLHSRKTTVSPKAGAKVKHPSWVFGRNFKFKHERWTQTYGWYQSSGDGDFYRRVTHRIHGKKYATLQLASGAGIWTDGYAYHTKHAAKVNGHRWFKGDRHNRD